MTIKFKKLHELFELPNKAVESDACFDVKATRIEYKSDGLVICYLGFSTEIPTGYKGVIVPRSSLTNTIWVMQNSPGQVDSGYRGEWQVRFRCIDKSGNPVFPFTIGDRVAQIYFEPVLCVNLALVEELVDTQRGSGGFGSTGK